MKKFLFFALVLSFLFPNYVNAQNYSYKETFDANSLEWTECAYESNSGTAIIDGGKMTITSKGEKKVLGMATGVNTFFETHCYAPLDVQKPFKIVTHVKIKKLDVDRLVGLVFNYRDGGNFYCFAFNDDMIIFERYENDEVVGTIEQGIKWRKKRNMTQEWELSSDGTSLEFCVDGERIMKVRYMPLTYTGFGYYTFGKQELEVDDVEFIQL